jgi:Rod binding domain-containing protein
VSGITGTTAAGAAAPGGERAQLRRLAYELESVFLNQLFQAMRAAVPAGGFIESSPGQEMFTAMLDEQLAREAAQRLDSKLSNILYRQLSRHLIDSADPDA